MITTLALTTTPNHKCFMTRRIRDSIPSNSENKPQGLHFSKALFEGLIFGGGLSMEGNLRFKSDWASLIVGRYKPPGGLYLEGRFNERL